MADVDLKRPKSGRLDSEYLATAARAAIQKLRADLARSERECAQWKAKAEGLEIEMERRARNENRNCVNWGPCSRNDGHMESAD